MSSLFLPLAAFAFACSCFCRRRFLASFPMCCVQWLCKDFELGRITSFLYVVLILFVTAGIFGALPLNFTYYSFLTGQWLVGLTWDAELPYKHQNQAVKHQNTSCRFLRIPSLKFKVELKKKRIVSSNLSVGRIEHDPIDENDWCKFKQKFHIYQI